MIDKEFLELYGLTIGDGTYYLDRGKYPHMIFYNFDLNIINRNELGQFVKSDCMWKLKVNLKQIMNFPYGVLK